MNLQNRVKEYLTHEPKFRERRHKDNGIVNLLIERYPVLSVVPKSDLIEAVRDYNAMDRYWRLLTSQNADLRGTDYDDKTQYSQKKQIELGYQAGYPLPLLTD